MIQNGTKLKVADNTGAKVIECIEPLGGSKRRYGRIGDIIVASVKEANPHKEIERGEVVHAVIVRQKQPLKRNSGAYIRFDENAAVLLEGKNPKGGRIFGPIPRDLREKDFGEIVSLAKEVV